MLKDLCGGSFPGVSWSLVEVLHKTRPPWGIIGFTLAPVRIGDLCEEAGPGAIILPEKGWLLGTSVMDSGDVLWHKAALLYCHMQMLTPQQIIATTCSYRSQRTPYKESYLSFLISPSLFQSLSLSLSFVLSCSPSHFFSLTDKETTPSLSWACMCGMFAHKRWLTAETVWYHCLPFIYFRSCLLFCHSLHSYINRKWCHHQVIPLAQLP